MTPVGFGRIFQASFVLPKRSSARGDEDGGTSAGMRTQRGKGRLEKPETRGQYRKTGVENDRSNMDGPREAVLRNMVAHHLLNHGHRRHPILLPRYEKPFVFLAGVFIPRRPCLFFEQQPPQPSACRSNERRQEKGVVR